MKVVIVGATGRVGSKILEEAVSRDHVVTAVSRNVATLPLPESVARVRVDVFDTGKLAHALAEHDAIVHAFAPPRLGVEERMAQQAAATQSIIEAAKAAGVFRILAVGGAGTLEVAPGVRNMDRPEFPAAWEGGARSTALIKELLSAQPELDWTFLCPPHDLFAGERTGKFRLAFDQLLVDSNGKSRISLADYAVAMIDELERSQHSRKRFTVGY